MTSTKSVKAHMTAHMTSMKAHMTAHMTSVKAHTTAHMTSVKAHMTAHMISTKAHMTAHMTSTKAQYNSTLNTVMCNRNAVQFLSRAVLYCSCMVHYQTMLWLCLHYRLCNIYILCVRIFISVGTQLQALAWLLIPRLVEDLPIAGNHFRKVNGAHTSEQLH